MFANYNYLRNVNVKVKKGPKIKILNHVKPHMNIEKTNRGTEGHFYIVPVTPVYGKTGLVCEEKIFK